MNAHLKRIFCYKSKNDKNTIGNSYERMGDIFLMDLNLQLDVATLKNRQKLYFPEISKTLTKTNTAIKQFPIDFHPHPIPKMHLFY